MNSDDFDELAGRIEAVCRLCLELTVVLENNNIIDGPRFSRGLRNSVQPKSEQAHVLLAAQKTLGELADQLDASRTRRQSQGGLK